MKKTHLVPLSIYYSFNFMSLGAFTSYIGLYYASINLSNAQIGILTSIGALIALVGQPFWGILSDRASYKNRVLFVCLAFSAAGIWLMPLSGSSFLLLLIFSTVFFFFQCAINPLSDTIALELASEGAFSFSWVRTAGSLGYALMSIIAGKIFEKNINYIFICFSTVMFMAFVFSFFIPSVRGHQRGGNKVKLLEIFKDKKLVILYTFTFIIQSGMGFFFGFHAIYSSQVGISTQVLGIAIAIGSFSQFPFMLFFDKFIKKFSMVNLMLVSGLVNALRWLLYVTCLNSITIYFLWALHGFTFVVFYLCLGEYVNSNVVKELRASGQMMNYIVLNGVSKIFGGFVGGLAAAAIGIKYTFAISFTLCLVAVAAFYIVVKVSPIFKTKAEVTSVDASANV